MNKISNSIILFTSLKKMIVWRDFPTNRSLTELNHIYLKVALYLYLISNLEKKIKYENILKIIKGNILSRISLFDINVNINEELDKKQLIEYIIKFYEKQKINLNNEELNSLHYYYNNNNNVEKIIWNFVSFMVNKFEYENLIYEKNKNIIPKIKDETVKKNFDKWENNLNKQKIIEEIKENITEEEINNILKYFLSVTYQERFNGVLMQNKFSIAEHQVFTFYIYNLLYMNKNLKRFNSIKKRENYIKTSLIISFFHDIVEGMTKDINSPLKKEVPGLSVELEKEEKYYLNNLFKNTPLENVLELISNPFENKQKKINTKELKFADDISALIEILIEIYYFNNKNPYLKNALNNIIKKYENTKFINIIQNILKIFKGNENYLLNNLEKEENTFKLI